MIADMKPYEIRTYSCIAQATGGTSRRLARGNKRHSGAGDEWVV